MDETTQQAPSTEEEQLRKRAETRVEDRIHLLQHIGSYIIVNGFLVVVWALTGAGYPWFLWVMAGWGIGLASHIVAYVSGGRNLARRERMVEKELQKMKQDD